MAQLRRSQRHYTVCYESNGRDYLASLLNFTISELEAWLASSTVHPHLILWYNICVLGRRRFNDGLDWIKTGDGSIGTGYFYDKNDLEEDLLLMCLGEGNADHTDGGTPVYADEAVRTGTWITQEIWARAAWRIVQNNSAKGQVFEKAVVVHPASAYGTAIDLLCIAFHSIAFRQSASVWEELILKGDGSPMPPTPSSRATDHTSIRKQAELDKELENTNDDEAEIVSGMEIDSDASSDISMADDGDDDFKQSSMAFPKSTSEPDGETIWVATPQAPRKKVSSPTNFMNNWLQSLPDSPGTGAEDIDDADPFALRMVDENGSPITG